MLILSMIAIGFIIAYGEHLRMNHAQLLALLVADSAKIADISTKVDALLAAVAAAGDAVPADVQEAANALGSSIDAVDAKLPA